MGLILGILGFLLACFGYWMQWVPTTGLLTSQKVFIFGGWFVATFLFWVVVCFIVAVIWEWMENRRYANRN